MPTRELVTDGEHRAALAVVRSLGRGGYELCVCGSGPAPLAAASRYARKVAPVLDPALDASGFVEAVAGAASAFRPEVLLPVAEASVLALLAYRERLMPARIPYPPLSVVRCVCDKAAVLEAAASLRIPVPSQLRVAAPADADRAAAGVSGYPVAVKPARSLNPSHGRLVKGPTAYAAGPGELQRLVASLPGEVFPVLVQQCVVGQGTGVFLLRWEGRVLAVFAHRRVREKPPSGGVSVCCESIAAAPMLVEQSLALLERLDWQGVAMVEYKVEAASGKPFLMEINGRFWGSLQLAVDAGVDLPAPLVAAALDRRPGPVTEYRVGVRTRWWWGDADHLIARLRYSPDVLGLPPGAPRRLRVALDVLLPRRGQRNEVLRWDDPMPFLRETLNWIRRR